MSRKFDIDSTSEENRKKILAELSIKLEPDKYAFNASPKYIYPFDVPDNEDFAYIPFSYGGLCPGGPFPRPEKTNLPSSSYEFKGELREAQKEVKNEAIEHLNKYGSTIVSSYVGFGKCLGINTPVMMYDGSIKMVQNIKEGDLLMGDDSTSRKVLNTCSGEEQMYDIIQGRGDKYTVNESHILSLKNESKNIEDICIRDYIKLSQYRKNNLSGYKVPIVFKKQEIELNPYLLGTQEGSIPSQYKYNCRDVQLQVLAGIIDTKGLVRRNHYEIYEKNKQVADDIVYIARSLGFYSNFYIENAYRIIICGNNLEDIPLVRKQRAISTSVKDDLLTDIKVVPSSERKYYGFSIDGNRRFLLGDFTVTHNTAIAIYLASKIKMKTFVIAHRIVLINQWKEAINRFCPSATIQILDTKDTIENCDFYIMNAINVGKRPRKDYKNIGLVVVDEIHCVMSEILSKSLCHLTPRYLLGLSATPYREDGLNILLDLYFGTRKIHRKLNRKHLVYRITTKFSPKVEKMDNGRLNWGVLLDSQAMNEERNEMIINLVKYFPSRVFLILCKRVDQGNYLVKRLLEEGEDVTSLIGKQQEYEKKSRILVGTASKTSTGFDHARLDAMILACDIQAYFQQALGRIMRTQEGIPMVLDIVDKNPVLERHYKVRKGVYTEHGGEIKDFSKSFPNFRVI